MKNPISALCILLFSLSALHPVGSLMCLLFGYEFSLASYAVYTVIILLIVAAALIMSIKFAEISKTVNILLIILPPVSFINAVIFLIKSTTEFTAVCMLAYFIMCCLLTIRLSKSLILKYMVITLSCLMVIPTAFFAFLGFVFGPISESTTFMTLDSPNKTYYVEVVDFDQGALGGDTLVYIHHSPVIDTFVFRIYKSPQLIYTGEWGEYYDMNIY